MDAGRKLSRARRSAGSLGLGRGKKVESAGVNTVEVVGFRQSRPPVGSPGLFYWREEMVKVARTAEHHLPKGTVFRRQVRAVIPRHFQLREVPRGVSMWGTHVPCPSKGCDLPGPGDLKTLALRGGYLIGPASSFKQVASLPSLRYLRTLTSRTGSPDEGS
jgi:hypothetical protein